MTLPLSVAGSQLAHAAAYRVAISDSDARAHELASTGHGYLRYATLAVIVCLVAVAVALVWELVRAQAGAGARLSAARFAVIGPAVFVAQEHLERLVHGGSVPWGAALEPTFVLGLLLQLPTAAAAFVVAWLLLRVVRTVRKLLAALPARPLRATACSFAVVPAARVRSSLLALGYPSRGPPASWCSAADGVLLAAAS